MERKTHHAVDGRLLQMNKRFLDMKMDQREKIAQWLYEEYCKVVPEAGFFKLKQRDTTVVGNVYQKIESVGIWIPYREIEQYYQRKKAAFRKRYLKETPGIGGANHGASDISE